MSRQRVRWPLDFVFLPAACNIFHFHLTVCTSILQSAHFCLKRNWKHIIEEMVASKVKSLCLSPQKKKTHLKKKIWNALGQIIFSKKTHILLYGPFFYGRDKNNLDVGLTCGWQWEFAAVGIKSQRPKMTLAKNLIWSKNVYKEARIRLRWKPDFVSDDIFRLLSFPGEKRPVSATATGSSLLDILKYCWALKLLNEIYYIYQSNVQWILCWGFTCLQNISSVTQLSNC